MRPLNTLWLMAESAFGVADWVTLLASSNRHNIVLSRCSPPKIGPNWLDGGKADWTLVCMLLSGRYEDLWPTPTQQELEIGAKLSEFCHEYIEYGGWLDVSNYEKRYLTVTIPVEHTDEFERLTGWSNE